MAKSLDGATKVNPRFFKGDTPEAVDVLPTNAATFIVGQPLTMDSDGLVAATADDAASVTHIAAEARATAATATYAKAFEVTPDMQFVMCVVNGTTDAAATQSMVGALYSVELISGVLVLDLDSGAAHTNDIFKVDGLMKDVEPERYALADAPGQVYGHFIATASTDVNAG